MIESPYPIIFTGSQLVKEEIHYIAGDIYTYTDLDPVRSIILQASKNSTSKKPNLVNRSPFLTSTNNNKVLTKIRSFSYYKDGWHNPESIAPTPKGLDDAERFASNIDWNQHKIPFISPATDGELNFWWDEPEIRLDLGFYGDRTYSYYCKLSNNQKFMGDQLAIKDPLPPEILQALKKIQ